LIEQREKAKAPEKKTETTPPTETPPTTTPPPPEDKDKTIKDLQERLKAATPPPAPQAKVNQTNEEALDDEMQTAVDEVLKNPHEAFTLIFKRMFPNGKNGGDQP
jgi:hypothetical protein